MATIPVIAVARSGNYDLISLVLSLSTPKDAKQDLAINLSGRIVLQVPFTL